MACNPVCRPFVRRALLIRVLLFLSIAPISAWGAPSDNAVAGRWEGRSPDPIGRTEQVELRFTTADSGLTGVLHVADRDIALENVRLEGRNLLFDATRQTGGRRIAYHYEGSLSGDTLDFTAQNSDGSSFFRFTVHRVQ